MNSLVTILLLVSAASSLKPALDEIAASYEKETKSKVTFNFGASGALQRQIENGAPVDVFFPASAKQLDELEGKGLLLAGTRKTLLKNSLVLVVPKGRTGVSSFEELKGPAVKKIAVGEPRTVAVGQYAAEALEKLGLAKALAAKLVTGENVRQVLTYVETGNVDAGVVYATDAQGSSKITVVAKADPAWHSPIVYPIAVVKKTKHEAEAKALVAYLSGKEAARIFRKFGFIVE